MARPSPAGGSWIAAFAAMTTEVHYSGQPLPSQGFLDYGLRRNDDKGGIPVGAGLPAWVSWIAASAAMTGEGGISVAPPD